MGFLDNVFPNINWLPTSLRQFLNDKTLDFKGECAPRVKSLLPLQAATWETCPFFLAAPFLLSIVSGNCIVFLASKGTFELQGIELHTAWDHVQVSSLDNLKSLVETWKRVSLVQDDTLWVPPGHLTIIVGGRPGCGFWQTPLVEPKSYLSLFSRPERRNLIGHNQKICIDHRTARTDWTVKAQGTVDSLFYLTSCDTFLAKLEMDTGDDNALGVEAYKFQSRAPPGFQPAPGLGFLFAGQPATPSGKGSKRERSLGPPRPTKKILGGGP